MAGEEVTVLLRGVETSVEPTMNPMLLLQLALCLLCCAFQSVGCAAKAPVSEAAHPRWLQVKIAELKSAPPSNVPVSVARAQYQGETVYYISPTVPDGYGSLFDAQGKLLGHPDGGMSGGGDGKCADYFETRTQVVVVWPAPQQ